MSKAKATNSGSHGNSIASISRQPAVCSTNERRTQKKMKSRMCLAIKVLEKNKVEV